MIVNSLDAIPSSLPPCALTIGLFDGVHLGHQHRLRYLKTKGFSVVVTFANHPSEILQPSNPTPLICTAEHRLHLLQQIGIDLIVVLPFDKPFSQLSYDQFLQKLKQKLPFTHLILSKGDRFGKNRQGDESHVKALAPTLNFQVEYCDKLLTDGQPISSTRIRSLIQQGDLQTTSSLLGRPHIEVSP